MSSVALLRPPKSDTRLACAQDELRELIARGAPEEGMNQVAPGLWFSRHSRPAPFVKWNAFGPSITIVAQGAKVSTYRGVKLTYDASRYLVVTGEGEFLGMVTEATPQRPFLSLCYQVPPEIVAKTLLALADSMPPSPVVAESVPAFIADLDAPIAETVLRMVRAMDEPLERTIVAPLAVEELVFRLLRTDAAAAVRSAVGADRDTDHQIRAAMQFLRANMQKPLAVEDVARHVAMSPSHFAHRFRAVARVTPMRYLKSLRLQHARTLLLVNDLRVSDAAARSGYESASHFTRDFKTFFGNSPAEYVRRFRDSQN